MVSCPRTECWDGDCAPWVILNLIQLQYFCSPSIFSHSDTHPLFSWPPKPKWVSSSCSVSPTGGSQQLGSGQRGARAPRKSRGCAGGRASGRGETPDGPVGSPGWHRRSSSSPSNWLAIRPKGFLRIPCYVQEEEGEMERGSGRSGAGASGIAVSRRQPLKDLAGGTLGDSVSPNPGKLSSPPRRWGSRPCTALGVSLPGRTRKKKRETSLFSAPPPAPHRLGSRDAPAGAPAVCPTPASLFAHRGSFAGGWERSCPRCSSYLDTQLRDQDWTRAHATLTSMQRCGHDRSSTHDSLRPTHSGTLLSFILTDIAPHPK